MKGWALKQIKEGQPSWGELTRRATSVEIVLEDNQLLANDANTLHLHHCPAIGCLPKQSPHLSYWKLELPKILL